MRAHQRFRPKPWGKTLFINNIIKKSGVGTCDIWAFLFVVCLPTLAFAVPIEGQSGGGSGSASTLGDMFGISCTNIHSFTIMFSYLSYAAGVVSTLMGINSLRLHTERPGNEPLNKGLMMFVGAACLLALPAAMTTVATSLGYANSPTMAVCKGAGGAGAGGGGLDAMFAAFVTNIREPLIVMVQVIANVCGAYMMVHGFMQASKYGVDARTNSIHKILTNIGFGAILFTIGGCFSMVIASVFGGAGVTDPAKSTVLAYKFVANSGGGSDQFATAIAAGLQFIQIIGFIAFVRGWLVMKKVVEGGGNASAATGITNIVGGVLAINISPFLTAMDKTFGSGIL